MPFETKAAPVDENVSAPRARARVEPRRVAHCSAAFSAAVAFAACSVASAFALGDLTLTLEDYAAAPKTGTTIDGGATNASYLARINFVRDEPGSNRMWINDLNGPLYLFDRATKSFSTYLNFNGVSPNTGLFRKLAYTGGYAGGFVTFQFHPEYATPGAAHFGVFYTVHAEDPAMTGSNLPNTAAHSGFNAAGYATTPLVTTPGPEPQLRHNVLIEWRDSTIADAVFTGTAREILRLEQNTRIHPIGDLLFNPNAAAAGHPDYGHMYVAIGDGADGETNQVARHANPQSLAALVGKILRIKPDDPDGAGPLTYSIPADNPFAAAVGARGEIWSYGFRNPHRLSWDAPADKLIACNIGFHEWEEVEIVRKGSNHGWADREGTHAFNVATGTSGALPANDATLGYTYPAIEYPHVATPGYASQGDAISTGFVYRGARFPFLWGKFLFADITTGELYYADFAQMLAVDDGNPATLAPFKKIKLRWDTPLDADTAPEAYVRMYEIVEAGYEARGGPAKNLPGSSTNSGTGRADVRLEFDKDGELFVHTKSDGMIRRVTEIVAAPEFETPPADVVAPLGGTAMFAALAVGSPAPTYQWQVAPAGSANFTDIPASSNATATSSTLVLLRVTSAMNGNRYRVAAANVGGATVSEPVLLTVSPRARTRSLAWKPLWRFQRLR